MMLLWMLRVPRSLSTKRNDRQALQTQHGGKKIIGALIRHHQGWPLTCAEKPTPLPCSPALTRGDLMRTTNFSMCNLALRPIDGRQGI